MAYTLQINSGGQQSLATLGVTAATLSLRANDFDSLTLTVDADLSAAPVFAPGDTITLRDGATVRFIGFVDDDPRSASAEEGPTHTYTALSHLAKLERFNFGQQTQAYFGTPAALGNVWDPLVTLGQDNSGTRCTITAQIGAIVDFAISQKSIPISRDPGGWPPGFLAPLDQRENITCWEAIITQLRWAPDHILWCDYSTGTTAVKLAPISELPASTIAASGGILTSAQFTPRRDLVLPGVRCLFRRVDEHDGKQREVRLLQTAGSPDAPGARDIFIDLEGGSSTSISQKIKVAAYPDLTILDGDLRTWLAERVPWLKDLAPADWEITAAVRSGTKNYAKELVEGSISSWMPVSQESEVITLTVDYATKDEGGKYVDKATVKLPIAVLSTNASTKTYRRTTARQSPETPPDGLAAGIHAAWSTLHWDAHFGADLATIGWAAIPGRRLNITGGPAAWATMGTAVQSADIHLADGTVAVTTGSPRALEPDAMTALYRALRGRRYSWKRTISGPDAESAAAMEGPESFPSDASADSPAFARRFLRISADLGEHTNDVTLDPAALVYANNDSAAPQDVKLREMLIPHIDPISGNPIARLSQTLCSAPYGDPIPIGGGAAENPGAAIVTIGAAAEGSETAATNTWTAGGANGLAEWYVSRVVYNHAGNKILYAFLRKRTYDNFGRLYSVGGETRVIVDEPAVLS